MAAGRQVCGVCQTPYKSEIAKFCSNCGTERSTQTNSSIVEPQPIPMQYTLDKPLHQVSEQYQTGLGSNSFSRTDIIPFIIASLTSLVSHIFKYMLLFNKFPTILEILYPLPMYVVIVFVIYILRVMYYNGKGVYIMQTVNRFGMMQAVVTSSFFLSIIPLEFEVDFEKSKLEDTISIPVKQGKFSVLQDIPKKAFIGEYLDQRYKFLLEVTILVLSLISFFSFVQIATPELYNATRLVTTYIAGMVVADTAPIFGRYSTTLSSLHRIRTFVIFLISLIIFTISVFDSFLDAFF